MKFAVDPWDPAYGASVESEMGQSEATVVTDIEVPDREWAPRPPPAAVQIPPAVVFVDGVRRLEARTWAPHPAVADLRKRLARAHPAFDQEIA